MTKFTFFIIIVFILCMSHNSFAKDKKTYAISQKVFKEVSIANKYIDLEQFDEAKTVLTELFKKRLSKYEQAQIWYMLASINYQVSDIPNAFSSFKHVLEFEGNIPESLLLGTLRTLTQLAMMEGNFKQASVFSEKLVDIALIPHAADHALLAQAYYKVELIDKAVIAIERARKITKEALKPPKENVMVLQNAIYFSKKYLTKMVTTLNTLVEYYPKPSYYIFLASIHGQLDQLKKQTIIMESLYEKGHLTKGSLLTNLASLYLSEKVPFKSAVLLEKEISAGNIKKSKRHYEMLSQAWRLAAEDQKALIALGEAAELDKDGDLYVKKAYLHYDLAEWNNAEKAIKLALNKGISEDKVKGEAWLLLGMVQFNLMAYDKAIEACQSAAKYTKSTALAERWIKYIVSEQRKVELMKVTL